MILAVIGGQYGSEGKGAAVAALAPYFRAFVRTGGPNAGHTIWHKGTEYKMRSIPCGWINPDAALYIGAGAIVDWDLLRQEAKMVDPENELVGRLFVDTKAWELLPEDRDHERKGKLQEKIGSTQEGIGVARGRRIQRGHVLPDRPLWNYDTWDTDRSIVAQAALGHVLLEGTQGAGLSLFHGPWPYVTSADCGVAALCSEAGIPPQGVRCLMVVRTYPIRVAGNSGPLPFETSWSAISAQTGRVVQERTTVTNKVRRVGQWDIDQVQAAVLRNAPDWLALQFLDYWVPAVYGATTWQHLTPAALDRIDMVQRETGVPVAMVGTGPHTEIMMPWFPREFR